MTQRETGLVPQANMVYTSVTYSTKSVTYAKGKEKFTQLIFRKSVHYSECPLYGEIIRNDN